MKNQRTFAAALKIETTEGDFLAHYSTMGLAQLDFPQGKKSSATVAPLTGPMKKWHALTSRAVGQVLEGKNITALPPVDLSCGTEFQKKVWLAMQTIPCGKTETYGSLARSLKKPNAARAVGGACGANPIPLLIPCHRVVAGNGGIGGFSSGLDWKKKLLARENSTPVKLRRPARNSPSL